MAYFERRDERDRLVVCNICNVKCAERSLTAHKVKCGDKPNHKIKFNKGELERCKYDSNHIVAGGKMDLHLEFCNKYQCEKLGEYQVHFQTDKYDYIIPEPEHYNPDCWSREIDDTQIVTKMMGGLNVRK